MYAIIVLLSSDWTILSLSKHRITLKDRDEMDRANKRWSNSMAQYNLMSFCLKDKPIRWYLELLQGFSYVYEMLEKHHYKSSVTVADNLKALIFQHLSDKSKGIKKERSDTSSNNYKELCAGRGDLYSRKSNIIVTVTLAGALRKTLIRAFFSGTLPLISCIILIIKTKIQARLKIQIVEP